MSKPVIQKIKFTNEQQQEIDLINKGQIVHSVKTVVDKKTGIKRDIVFNRKFTEETGRKRMVSLYGGLCCICGNYPNFKVLYDVGEGAKRVERYCQNDYDKWQERIKK